MVRSGVQSGPVQRVRRIAPATPQPPDEPRRQARAAARRARATAGQQGRLGRGDWIAAGQDILRAQGIAGLKLAALTRRVGVSTGSFYHHFTDFDDYLGAVADAYPMERVQSVLDQTARDQPDPLTRMRRLARNSVQEGTFELDRAMRVWATMDARVEAVVRKAEALVLAFLAEAFAELGFDRSQAEQRARMLLAINVTQLVQLEPAARRDFLAASLDLLAERR